MSFAHLKARRAARDGRWRARGRDGGKGRGEDDTGEAGTGVQEDEEQGTGIVEEEQHEPHLAGTPADDPPPELRGSQLTLFTTAGHGRGLQRARDAPGAQAGDELLAVEPHASVLSTAQADMRCHYCFVKRAALQRCSGCKFARYCSAACQRSAWTKARHRDECPALQRWFAAAKEAGHAPADPGAAVRVLAQLVWHRRKHGVQSAWWKGVASMQSHRATMSEAQQAECAELAFRVAHFLTLDALPSYGFDGASGLLDMVCAYRTNAFTLADAQLDPIGVSVSVPVALFNHACDPNAVVVFPRAGDRTMRVVAIKPIAPGAEVLTSYVDLAEPLAQRQATLSSRYLFTCTCRLCTTSAHPPKHWTDPRTAIWCEHNCSGWAALPNWRQLPVDDTSLASGACNRCGKTSMLHAPREIHARWTAAEALMERVQKAMQGEASHDSLGDVLSTVRWLSTLAPPSNTLLWTLMHAAHVLAIETGAFAEATHLAFVLCAGMQACGGREADSALYPPGHPLRAVMFATLGKLLLHETPPCPPLLARMPAVPADRAVQLALARQALVQALDEARCGFGRSVDGGDVAADVRDSLTALEQEQAVLRSM